MNFLFTTDVNTNIKRIKNRVIQGGHHISSKDVKRRYHRGLVNFIFYAELSDIVDVYDTTQGNPLLFLRSAENSNGYKVYDLNLAEEFQQRIADASRSTHKRV